MIAEGLKSCVAASVEFGSAITGVFKTVDGTDAQLSAISDGIRQMATEIPATTTEISAVAESAGQLGIATDDVLSFTRTMIDLGNSTNLTADEAASAFAKFANITGTASEDYGRLADRCRARQQLRYYRGGYCGDVYSPCLGRYACRTERKRDHGACHGDELGRY